ncbi:MAG: nucleotidyltransferase domain-containing protein [Chloroflexi bacterium]|nr:nucleotidyltransferase domain-containing protein [Chloroflexota bacterium]
MGEIELRSATGDPEVDRIMRGYVGVFETAFPGAVRAYYLTGSFAEGTAAPTSDVDVNIVFKEGALRESTERRMALQLEKYCNSLSRIPVGAGRYQEHDLLDFGDRGSWYDPVGRRVYLKLASHHLHGEDIRQRIPLPSAAWWACSLMAERYGNGALRYLAEVRGLYGGKGKERLAFPLRYPDPDGGFFGYDRVQRQSRDGTVRRTTRGLVRAILGGANALVAWRAGRCVVRKQEIALAYRKAIGDQWVTLVETADQLGRVELGYLVPEDAGTRRRLRDLCAAALEFENHFLAAYREFALEELAGAARDAAWLPVELAGWLLLRAVEDRHVPAHVEGWASQGGIPVQRQGDQTLVAARPCLEAWAAGMLGWVLFPGDERVAHGLSTLVNGETAGVRHTARASLAALDAVR